MINVGDIIFVVVALYFIKYGMFKELYKTLYGAEK